MGDRTLDKDSRIEHLGEPGLRLAGFQVWVHGRQYPDEDDCWDGNWLNVSAHCGGEGASVWAQGPILDTVSVLRFRDGLAALHKTLRGAASLESVEPNVSVRVEAMDTAGHILVQVDITPNHMEQSHRFRFEIDQTYLPQVVGQCEKLLELFPVRHPAQRGV